MTRARIWAIGLLAASLATAVLARPHSTGARLRGVATSYMESLAAGRFEEAYGMLGDSLRGSLSAALLQRTAPRRPLPSARLGGREAGAFTVGFRSEDGTTRNLRLAIEGDRTIVTGDSRIEAVMGGAREMCIGYATSTVAPALMQGADAADFDCPVTGRHYRLSGDGRLVCPAGHLGGGVMVRADACSDRRDSLAALVSQYAAQRGRLPSDFPEMYAGLDLPPRQRVGYSCPSNANEFYAIRPDSTIWCPFHGEATPVEVSP